MKLRQLRLLSALSCVSHLLLGVGIWLDYGAVAHSSAWLVMERVFPTWLWPSIFIAVGILAGIAAWDGATLARVWLYFGAGVMVAWAVASLFAWIEFDVPQPSVAWLLYIGALKAMLAWFSEGEAGHRELISRVLELREEISNDNAEHGPATT